MRATRGLLLWSLALTALGVVLLLNNFLLISGFNVATLWPLLLVIVLLIALAAGWLCLPMPSAATSAEGRPELIRS